MVKAAFRFVNFIVFATVFVIAVAFLTLNSAPVTLNFFLLAEAEVPLYLVIAAATVFGWTVGAAGMWMSAGGLRRRANKRKVEVERLKREVETVAAGAPTTGLPALRS